MIEGGGVPAASTSITPASGATSPGASRDRHDDVNTGSPGMSQSQDSEASPPIPRHPSKSNFFQADGISQQQQHHPGYHHHHHHHPHHPHHHGYTTDSPRKAGQQMTSSVIRPPRSPHSSRPPRMNGNLRSRSTTPDPLSPERPSQASPQGGRAPPSPPSYIPPKPPSPTLHQRMKQLGGVATPLAMSSPLRRSNPPTPTQPRRPDFIGVAVAGVGGRPVFPYYSQFSYEAPKPPTNSPQRRFMSESELVQTSQSGVECSVVGSGVGYPPRTTTMFDNIQELASSPQHGQYSWRESPPHYCSIGEHVQQDLRSHHRSNPTSPTQTCPPYHYCPPTHREPHLPPVYPGHYYTAPPHHQYHHQQQQQQEQHYLQSPPQQNHFTQIQQQQQQQHSNVGRRNSGPSYISPQSPQIRRKNYMGTSSGLITPPTPTEGAGRPSPIQKRPVSLMRSLDLMDNMEMTSRGVPAALHPVSSLHQTPLHPPHSGVHSPTLAQKGDQRLTSPQDLERRSAYDMNYEISV